MKNKCATMILFLFVFVSCQKRMETNSPSGFEETISPMPPVLGNFWVQLTSQDQQGFGYRNCSFSLNGKGYVILGYFDQLWEFDPASNSWSNKGNTPHSNYTSYAATAFSIGGKGYYYTNDGRFWEYDVVSNTWTQKANFPGIDREYAVGYAIGTKGYMGTGYQHYPVGDDNTLGDWWEYNPSNNVWTQKANAPGLRRAFATGFSTSARGYLGTGKSYLHLLNGNTVGVYQTDWWEYNPSTNAWMQKANYPGQSRLYIAGFSISDILYMGLGNTSSSAVTNEFYSYNPATDQWLSRNTPSASLSGEYLTGFSIGASGYVVEGNLHSFWKYYK